VGKVESLRMYSSRSSSDLLELLEAGEPAAFATDSRHRVVFWNAGAARVFGKRSEDAIGRHCFDVIGGRDVFGNRFCHAGCAMTTMARAEEPLHGFEMLVHAQGGCETPLQVTTLRMPGPMPELFTLVHMIHPVGERARLARDGGDGADAPAPEASSAPRRNGGEPADQPPLTAREREVLRWVAAGHPNKDIARELGLSLATVRNHVHNTLEKLGVHSKLEAASLAFRSGWVEDESSSE
jgi:DNA-binding CsgD family transcriptional regulator